MSEPYNPYNQHQNSFVPSHAPRTVRSAIPKVIGILMIIFGSLALLSNLVGQVLPADPNLSSIPAWKEFDRVSKLLGLVQLPVSFLQLFTGIMLVKYKAIGPKLALVYGVLAAVHTIVNLIILQGVMKPAMDSAFEKMGGGSMKGMGAMVGFGMILGGIIGLAWPTLILILTQRRNAKAACIN
jgi:hypothetical protein